MVRRSVLATFMVMAIVLGGVAVSTPASAVIDSAVVIPSPNTGANTNNLYSVSCVTASFCVATGTYNNGVTAQTLVLQWDGTAWTVMPSPNAGANANVLNSVSCVTASFCVATGTYNNGVTAQTLVLQWDGTAWTVMPSPNAGTNANVLSVLYSVSCVTASFCVAAGNYDNGVAGQTLVLQWDGTAWTVMPSPNTGTDSNFLYSVSCVNASFCVATGAYGYVFNRSASQTLVLQWDGTAWTVMPSPNTGTDDNALNSVLCVTASSCVATGYYINGSVEQTLVVSLTGPVPPSTTTTTVPPSTTTVASDQVVPVFTG